MGGLPDAFLFVGEGELNDSRSVYFEASWDSSAGFIQVPQFSPEFEPVIGPLVAGYLEIGDPAGVIPEPITLLGVGLGVAGMSGYIRKRRIA